MKGSRRSYVSALMRRFSIALVAAGLVLPVAACGHKSKDQKESAKSDTLPALTIGEDTPNLMLTWIDLRGGTHVEMKVSAVPAEGRKLVRVLISGDEAGTGDPIYVTDLTEPTPDGKFATRPMSRREWEDEIERRRGARVASLPDGEEDDRRPSPMPRRHRRGDPDRGPDLPQVPDLDDGPSPGDPSHKISIVIYGASWCGPCHQAMHYLDRRHVAYTFKDIEKDAGADQEMSAKLAKGHLRGGSIPVIDVGGRILIGYDADALDAAIKAASGGTAL
jgi:glutaredoxin